MSAQGNGGCPSFEELMALMDGEVSEDTRKRLERHIAQCPSCSRIVDTQKRMESCWRQSWSDPPKRSFTHLQQNVLRRRGRARRLWRFGLPVAAAIVAALVGLRLFVPGTGGLLGSADSPASRAARRAESVIEGAGGGRMNMVDTAAVDSMKASGEGAEGQLLEEASAGEEQAPEREGGEETEEIIVSTVSETAAEEGFSDVSGFYGGGGAVGAAAAEPDQAVDQDDVLAGVETASSGTGLRDQPPVDEAQQPLEESVSQGAVWEDENQPAEAQVLHEAAEPPGLIADGADASLAESLEAEEEAQESFDADGQDRRIVDFCASASRQRVGVFLAFDSTGSVSSESGPLLDSLAPNWRTALDSLYTDTTLTMPLDSILELLEGS